MEALHTQAQALGFRSGARIVVEIDELLEADRLPTGAQEMVFRIVQETFANIARHARASTIWLRLYQQNEALHVEIRDDGQGFDLATVRRGMGLANLHERAKSLLGTVEIQSAVGEGTMVRVHIPLLEPLSKLQEREQIKREVEQANQQARWNFQLSANASLFTIGFLFLALFSDQFSLSSPLLLGAGFCFLVVLYGYLSGRYYSASVMLNVGEDTLEPLLLKERIHETHLWLWRILLVAIWYFFIVWRGWQSSSGWLLALASSLLMFGLVLLDRKIIDTILNRYYALLSEQQRRWEIGQQVRQSASIWRIWLLPFVLVVLDWSRRADFSFPPTTTQGWSNYAQALGILGWGSIVLARYLQARRWQRSLWQEKTP
jgi:anti-sigma regulatory factor (Ser/Thr protein kinase)